MSTGLTYVQWSKAQFLTAFGPDSCTDICARSNNSFTARSPATWVLAKRTPYRPLASIQSIQRYLKNLDAFQLYTGRVGTQGNFNLVAGEAYIIRMNTTTAYIPSHF